MFQSLRLAVLAVTFPCFTYAATLPTPRYHVLMDRDWRFFLGDTAGADAAAFDDHSWRVLDLPHDWSIEGPFDKAAPTGGGGGYLPTGIGWYRKQWNLPSVAKGKKVSVLFDGVYMNSDVWINGHLLGHRPNGYISFSYDLTPFLHPGKNVLAVRVDNSRQPNSRWYSGSGIYRHVWLDINPPVHIAQWGTYVTTPVVDSVRSTVNVVTTVEGGGTMATINHHGGPDSLTSTVLDEAGRVVAMTTTPLVFNDSNAVITQQLLVAAPQLWSVDAPHLYTLHSMVRSGTRILDAYNTPFGIRSLTYSADSGFLLNGHRVKMNGVCVHGDAGCVGTAVPLRMWKDRLFLLRQMGCNAIRTSHNPVAPEFLDLCDQLGFLVMDEAFDAWETQKVANDYHLYFDQWSQQDVTDQIHRDRNHPSVVLWSAGNEIPDQTKEKGIGLLQALVATYHREDPTRPVTTANDDIAADNGSTLLPFMEAEDIVGYNYVDRWHERRELFYGVDHASHPTWKMIGTESESVRSPQVYSLGKDPQKVRPNYLSGMVRPELLWKFVAVHDYVIGDFMWTGIDYLGEARWPGKGSSSGEIDMTNLPKDGFYFYQSQWTTTPVLHLLPHWNWAGREGQVIPVLAYTNCDTVDLYVNGKFWASKSTEFPRQGNSGGWNKYARPYVNITTADLHLSWDVPYEAGTIKAVGHKGGQVVAVTEIHTTGKPAAIRLTADTTLIDADGSDVATVRVSLLDNQGNIVPDADTLVTVKVTGAGRLIGLDNGNQLDTHTFSLPQRTTYNGHAFAVVQSTRAAGTIQVTVRADGLPPATLAISTRPPIQKVPSLEDLR